MLFRSKKDFVALSGDDPTALGYIAHGGRGCISVTANIAPRLCAEFEALCLKGEYAKALTIQDRLIALHDVLFIEASPAPTKFAGSLMGLFSDEVRLPIVPCSEGARAKIRDVLTKAKFLG